MRFTDVAELLAAELTVEEDPNTRSLIGELRVARQRGYLKKREFLDICRWKSPRAVGHCNQNSHQRIRRITTMAFASRSERVRFDALTSLDGVGAPTASAILTLTNPRRYGVIDIRVWRLLFDFGEVRSKPSGVGFGFDHWQVYLATLRHHARTHAVPVRAVEYSLFRYHQRVQRGRLYHSRARGAQF